jgi:hypothetical protein
MNYSKKLVITALISFLIYSLTLSAKPKDPRRETARCNAERSLCKNVAGTDYRHCVKAKQGHCKENYNEDIEQCNTDHKSCIDRI